MRALLETLADRGTLVDPDAMAWLEAADDEARSTLLAAPDLPMVLTRGYLETLAAAAPPSTAPAPVAAAVSVLLRKEREEARALAPGAAKAGALLAPPESAAAWAPAVPRALLAPAPQPVAPLPRPVVEPYGHRFDVVSDVTGNSLCDGEITDFTRYFNDRLAKIRKLLKQRREMVGQIPIKAVRPGAQAEIKLIGMVTEIRKTKNGHRLLELEDETGVALVLAPANDPSRISDADTLVEDEVVGIVAKPAKGGDLLILEKIVRPDVPLERQRATSPNDARVAFLSDIHFGSKTFLHDDWERFVRFITLEDPDHRRREIARRVRYLVVNGDVADGIGIFPGQEEELAIVDAYGQYDFAGREFTRIQEARPDLKVFVLPGNHDLVRPAEPQPAFPEKYRRLFPKETVFCGNPLRLTIEGVDILSYHGRSFDDWVVRVQGMSYSRPLDAMRQMVQRRHMVPIYGLRTPLAPEHKDYMVIETVPDVFATGHVHAAGLEVYRGITLVNSSCWQGQTTFQKMHGFEPTPGRVPIYDLKTGASEMLDFHTGDAGVDRTGLSKLPKPDPRVPAGAVA